MENGIFRIFPTLVPKSMFTVTLVFDKPIAVEVAIVTDPFECQLNGWPETRDKILVCSALIIAAGQHNKKRGSINRPVIKTKWNLSQRSHFPAPLFVKDLPRLGVLGRI